MLGWVLDKTQKFSYAYGRYFGQQREIESTYTYRTYLAGRFFIYPFMRFGFQFGAYGIAVLTEKIILNNLYGLIGDFVYPFLQRELNVTKENLDKFAGSIIIILRSYFTLEYQLYLHAALILLKITESVVELPTELKALLYILVLESNNILGAMQQQDVIEKASKALNIDVKEKGFNPEEHFNVHGNVPLHEAETVIFAEEHNDQKMHWLESLYLAWFAKPDDKYCMEGADKNLGSAHLVNTSSPLTGYKLKLERYDSHKYITSVLEVSSWDDYKASQSIGENLDAISAQKASMDQIMKEIETVKQAAANNPSLEVQALLIERMHQLAQQAEKIINNFDKTMQNKPDDQTTITERNEGIVTFIKEYVPYLTKYINGGMGHFYPQRVTAEIRKGTCSPDCFNDIKPDDPQYPLREALEEVSHVILTAKK